MEMKDIIKALVIAVLTSIVGLIFKYIDPPTIITEVWQRVFVGPWFIWLGAAGFGVYWFVRLVVKLHHDTTNAIPALIRAQEELTEKEISAKTQPLEILHSASELSLEQEARSRVAGDDGLSGQLNGLDTRFQSDLNREVGALHAKLDELLRKEAHARTDGINAINHRIDLDFERMNKLETSLPNQMSGRIQEIERKLTTQISALNERVRNVEPPRLTPNDLNDIIKPPTRPFVPTPEGLGLANSIPPAVTPESLGLGLANSIPTTQEIMAQAIIDHNKNKNKKKT